MEPTHRKKKSRKKGRWTPVITALIGLFAGWVSFHSFDAISVYLSAQLGLGNLAALVPIASTVALATIAIALVKMAWSSKSLRNWLPPARLVRAYWVELPTAIVFLLYGIPGIYSIWVSISAPCASAYYFFQKCFWAIDAVEFVILVQILFIFGIVLALDVLRIWLKFRKPRKAPTSKVREETEKKPVEVF